MYRLLIVDDEQMIVDWLYRLFENLSYLELDIYKANSGYEAVNLLNSMKIDIVLTDIRMPEMNGLQMLEIIKDNWPQCRVIFLTGYNEFDYVYNAIKHEGVNYLLKTEDDSTIIQVVKKTIEEIEKSYKNSELVKKAAQQINLAMPLLQREYLLALIMGDDSVLPVRQQQLEELSIPLKSDIPLILLLGRVDNLSKKLSWSEKSKSIYTIKGTIEQYYVERFATAHLLFDDCWMVWFVQPIGFDDNKTEGILWDKALLFVRETLETVQKVCMEALGSSISFSLVSEPIAWNAIPEKYYALKQLMNSMVGFESGMILSDMNPLFQHSKEDDFRSDTQSPDIMRSQQNKIDILENYLERGQKMDFFEVFINIAEEMLNIKSMHSYVAKEMYYALSLTFLSYINRCYLVEKLAYKIDIHKLTRTEDFDSWNDAIDYLHSFAEIIFELQDSEQRKRSTDMVSIVQEYILKHLSEDISLQKLAELVYFNPSYLSRMFKQTTGMNVTDYIHNIRLNKAKELLNRNEMKIHEIATALGYESAAYFSKFFKKLTGISPQEYRNASITI